MEALLPVGRKSGQQQKHFDIVCQTWQWLKYLSIIFDRNTWMKEHVSHVIIRAEKIKVRVR